MPKRIGPLLKSIATVSISGTLPEKLEAAAAIGFDAVEPGGTQNTRGAGARRNTFVSGGARIRQVIDLRRGR